VPDAPVGCLLGCGQPALRRGLWANHYRQACRRVRKGETTWAELVQAGQAWRPPPRDRWKRRPGGRRDATAGAREPPLRAPCNDPPWPRAGWIRGVETKRG
jgi:hypothetical protein